MLIFFLVFILVVGTLYLFSYLKTKKQTKKVFVLEILSLVIAFVLPIVIYALRDFSVGLDTLKYKQIFYDIGEDHSFETFFSYDFLYSLINIISYSIIKDFTMILFIVGTMIFMLVSYSSLKLSSMPYLSMAIYLGTGLYAQSFNLIRQYLALSMIMLGLYFLIKKKNVKVYVFLVILGALFHKTALIALSLLLFRKLKFNFKTLLLVSMLTILSIFLFPALCIIWDKLFSTSYYLTYCSSPAMSFNTENIVDVSLLFLCLLVAILFRKKVRKNTDIQESQNYDIYLFMLLVCTVIYLMSCLTVSIVNTFCIYFVVSLMFIFPSIQSILKFKERTVRTIILIVGLALLMYCNLGALGLYGVIPYRFI